MTSLKSPWVAVCLTAVLAASTPVAAQESREMSQKEMMERMMKYTTPTKAHDFLKNYVGTWEVDATTYEQPGAQPTKSRGTMTGELLFGGRFAECRFSGQMMGQPFMGIQIEGFDLFQQKYVGLWIDSMSTNFFLTSGTLDASGKVLTETGMLPDPRTGSGLKVRSVTTLLDGGKYRYEMYHPGPDGKEFKAMEIVYTRKMGMTGS
jgi:hypothetical protein